MGEGGVEGGGAGLGGLVLGGGGSVDSGGSSTPCMDRKPAMNSVEASRYACHLSAAPRCQDGIKPSHRITAWHLYTAYLQRTHMHAPLYNVRRCTLACTCCCGGGGKGGGGDGGLGKGGGGTGVCGGVVDSGGGGSPSTMAPPSIATVGTVASG